MIHNLFVSYELAIQLKEKKFDEPCLSAYGNTKKLTPIAESGYRNNVFLDWPAAPLYQQVIYFLREKYKIFIGEVPYTSGKHKWQIWKWNPDKILWESYIERIETQEEAIIEALKLLP